MFTSPWFFFGIAAFLFLMAFVVEPLWRKRKPKKDLPGPRRDGKTTPKQQNKA